MKLIMKPILMDMLCVLFKSFLLTFFIAILTIFILSLEKATAQGKAIIGSKRLNIGDYLPVELWRMPLTSISPLGSKTISLEEYKGKAIILDFWASWCAPCLEHMPALDSMHSAKKNLLSVIMVNATSNPKEFAKVCDFVIKYHTTNPQFFTPMTLYSKTLEEFFPYTEVPHYVWIGADGRVKAITSFPEVTSLNIDKLIAGGDLNLSVKSK